jgi:hypothetical protein
MNQQTYVIYINLSHTKNLINFGSFYLSKRLIHGCNQCLISTQINRIEEMNTSPFGQTNMTFVNNP